MRSSLLFICVLLLCTSGVLGANDVPRFDIPIPSADRASPTGKPAELKDVRIEQRLGNQLPLDTTLVDENGHAVKLGDYFGTRPVLLSFVQYRCPMLCTQVLNAQCRAVNACALAPGADYDMITISFDSREGSTLSAAKKHIYDAQVSHGDVHDHWHFLTGTDENIRRITDAAGFYFVYDPRLDQFIHASGIMVATPDGKMSKYLFGIEYSPNDLRLAVATARREQAGTLSDAFLLYCFHYDPIHGRYTLAVTKLLAISGGITLIIVGGYVVYQFTRDHRRYGKLTV